MVPALVIAIGFSINFHREAKLDWNDFEAKFESTSLPVASSPEGQIAHYGDKKNEAAEGLEIDQSLALQNDEDEETPYEPTTRDPLHFVSQTVTSSPHFQGYTNFTLDELDLIKQSEEDLEQFAAIGHELVQNLIECMSSGKCIEEMGEVYRDISEMRSHQLLERVLYIGLALQDSDPSLSMITQDQILALLTIDSAPLHYATIELIGHRPMNERDFRTLLEQSGQVAEEARGHLFAQLENHTRNNDNLRNHYMNQLRSELSQSPNAAVEILKHLQFIRLDQQELTLLSQGLCQHRESDIANPHQWEMIQFHHGQYTEMRGISVDLTRVCQ